MGLPAHPQPPVATHRIPPPGDIIDLMSESILIRKLPAGAKQRLRERAAAHGRSVEAEARAILVDTVFAEDFVLEWLDAVADLPPGPAFEPPSRAGAERPVDLE